MGKNQSSSPARNSRRISMNPRDVEDRRIRRLKKLRSVKFTAEIRVDEEDRSKSKNITVLSFTGNEKSPVDLGIGGLGSGPGYGVVSMIGKRNEMEDAARAKLAFAAIGEGIKITPIDFFGVYDGHGGGHVARLCRERLHEVLAEEIVRTVSVGDDDYWERVMEGCFGKFEEEVGKITTARTVGSTAVISVVSEDKIIVANCGDCRAVLFRDGFAVPLSIDHKPNRPDELQRIEAAGGRVINWDGYRVLGVLATSRSIGDEHLRPFVISTPEVTVTKRTKEDEFMILASDGLWDVVSNEMACKVVKKCLGGRTVNSKKAESRASNAAALLAELAMAWGSRDNISVIVVDLRKS